LQTGYVQLEGEGIFIEPLNHKPGSRKRLHLMRSCGKAELPREVAMYSSKTRFVWLV